MLRLLRLVAAVTTLAALAVIPPAIASAGGGCHPQPGAVRTEGTTSVVRMDVCSFEPTVARVAVGTEVRFLNTATVVHLVTGTRQEWGSDGELAPGAETRQRFDSAGIYPFSCPLHPGMVGAVVVGDPSAAAAPVAETAAGSPTTPVSQVSAPGVAPAAALAIGVAGLIGGLAIARLLVARSRATA